MEDEHELIVSLNYKQSFDLDFNNAYLTEEEDYFQYMHPCYKLEEESVGNQDWVLGRDLLMYGSHEDYNTEILSTSKCHIGLRNPGYRISDESFCKTILQPGQRAMTAQKRYTFNSIINFFLIGFSKFNSIV
jgi:hypothetical protein